MHTRTRGRRIVRRLLIGTLALAALGAPGAALAGGSLPGAWAVKVASPPQAKGSWVVRFTPKGAYTVALNGRVVIHGTYVAQGATLKLGHESGPDACPATGTYGWTRSGDHLTLVKRSDSVCTGRAGVLAHRLTLTPAGSGS